MSKIQEEFILTCYLQWTFPACSQERLELAMRAERIIHDFIGTEKGTSHCCEKGMEPHFPGLGTSLRLIKNIIALVRLGQGSICLFARHIARGRLEVKRKLFYPWENGRR